MGYEFFFSRFHSKCCGVIILFKKNAFVDVEHNVISDQKSRHIALDISIC